MKNKKLQEGFKLFILIISLNLVACTQTSEKSAANNSANNTNEQDSTGMDMNVTKTDFGEVDGTPVALFTLTNENGVEARIINYGGIVVSLKVPDKDGQLEDVVLGFDSLAGYTSETYLQEGPYFGALIGRYGNRIADGKFTLDGQEYTLATNNGPNHLHGGLKGFDNMVWDAEEFQHEDEVGVKLHYLSEDMEEGYPGNLDVTVTYALTNDNALSIAYSARTDKKTIVNLTNHSYFNLTGGAERDILDHQVMINADKFVPVDETLIPTGELRSVEGTPFDFTEPVAVGKRIEADNQQLTFGKGYDHCWVLNGAAGERKLAATVYSPGSGRFMEVFTTEPGIQFYTGNFLNGKLTGKGGVTYEQRYGLCLETEHFPDSPNQPDFPSVVLDPDEVYETTTTYKFSVK